MNKDRRRYRGDSADESTDGARGGIHVNWTAIATIMALFTWTVSGVWFAATQNASIIANHNSETAAINSTNAAIAQLQSNEKENDKQRVEILLHLSSIDQSLRDILNNGMPRNAPMMLVPSPPSGTAVQQAPAAEAPGMKQQ
jgi:hypothetical protein